MISKFAVEKLEEEDGVALSGSLSYFFLIDLTKWTSSTSLLPRENDKVSDWQLQGQKLLSPLKTLIKTREPFRGMRRKLGWIGLDLKVLVKVQFRSSIWGCRTVTQRPDTHLEKQREGQTK